MAAFFFCPCEHTDRSAAPFTVDPVMVPSQRNSLKNCTCIYIDLLVLKTSLHRSPASMTLSLRDINGCESGLFNYRHFSRISILSDTLQRETGKNNSSSSLVLDRSLKQVFDKPFKSFNDYEGENWSEALCTSKPKTTSERLLNIDSDSVLNFSIASAPKLNSFDGSLQIFTPTVLCDGDQFNLEELNAHVTLLLQDSLGASETDSCMTKIGLKLIPQTVKLNQAFTRFNNDPKGKATNKSVVKFVELCNQLIDNIWLPHLAEALNSMKTALEVLDQYKDKYTKVELKTSPNNELNLLIHQWSMLNYFPMVLINSLNFKVLFASEHNEDSETQSAVATQELYKILFITWSLEISKSFIKLIDILLDLDASAQLNNHTVISTVATLLDSTVESHTGEIMIGIDQLVKQWINEKSKFDPPCKVAWNQWSQSVLQDYKIRFHKDLSSFSWSSEESAQEVAELMFDKFDVGKIFVEEIFRFTQTEVCAKPTLNGNSLGWLTIFDEDEHNTDGPAHSVNDNTRSNQLSHATTLRSLFPPATSRQVVLASNTTNVPNIPLVQPNISSKKTTVKEWALKLKQKFQDLFHLSRQPKQTVISSVRYYKAVAAPTSLQYNNNNNTNSISNRRCLAPFPGDTTTFAEDQRSRIEELTRKLYKKEKQGRRKRDALRVIFS